MKQHLANHLVKLQDLPAAFRGHCCLDVDLAFVGPADPRRALPVGHDGTLAFEVRSLRVPPLDHGYVSLRVCEAARLEGTAKEPEGTPKRTTESTENGAVLEREMLKNRRHEAPKLSRCRALWSSGSVLLGSWAGILVAKREEMKEVHLHMIFFHNQVSSFISQ